MKKAGGVLLILAALVAGWFVLHRPLHSPDGHPLTVESVSETPSSMDAGHPAAGTTPPPAGATPGPAGAAVSHSASSAGQKVPVKDLYGHEYELQTPAASAARERLNDHSSIDPDKDFDSLSPPDFGDQHTAMFSGTFEDPKTGVQLYLAVDMASAHLSETSCVVTKESGAVAQTRDLPIQVRDDRAGYAGLMVKHRWYFKLAYAFSPRRTLYGVLYELGEDGWQPLYGVAAQERPDLKVQCPPRTTQP